MRSIKVKSVNWGNRDNKSTVIQDIINGIIKDIIKMDLEAAIQGMKRVDLENDRKFQKKDLEQTERQQQKSRKSAIDKLKEYVKKQFTEEKVKEYKEAISEGLIKVVVTPLVVFFMMR